MRKISGASLEKFREIGPIYHRMYSLTAFKYDYILVCTYLQNECEPRLLQFPKAKNKGIEDWPAVVCTKRYCWGHLSAVIDNRHVPATHSPEPHHHVIACWPVPVNLSVQFLRFPYGALNQPELRAAAALYYPAVNYCLVINIASGRRPFDSLLFPARSFPLRLQWPLAPQLTTFICLPGTSDVLVVACNWLHGYLLDTRREPCGCEYNSVS